MDEAWEADPDEAERKPGTNDGWAWAFSQTRNGGILREALQLVQALEQYGAVKVGKYVITLSGRDGNLLNRKLVKR